MKKLLFLILFLFLFQIVIIAQIDTTIHKKGPYVWVNIGLGVTSYKNASAKLDLDILEKKNLITIGFLGYSETNSFFETSEAHQDYYLQYGRNLSLKNLTMSLSGGISNMKVIYVEYLGSSGYIWGTDYYNFRKVNYLGLALKFQAIIYYKVIGIGFSVQANINRRRSYIGFGLNLSLGRL